MKKSQIGQFFPGDRWWRYPRIFSIPRDIYTEIRSFIHRGVYGWAEEDVWNLDSYLEEVILGSILHLTDYGFGYPGVAPFETRHQWMMHLQSVAGAIDAYHRMRDDMTGFDSKDPLAWHAKERESHQGMMDALKRLLEHWESLWD